MDFIKNLFALIVFFCVAALLLYVGVAVLLVALAVGAVAAVWYAVKFYFIRRELVQTMREHQNTRFHSAVRRDRKEEQGDVIDGEFVELDDEKDSTPRS